MFSFSQMQKQILNSVDANICMNEKRKKIGALINVVTPIRNAKLGVGSLDIPRVGSGY